MGQYVGKLIAARIAGRIATKPFRYMHLGDKALIDASDLVANETLRLMQQRTNGE